MQRDCATKVPVSWTVTIRLYMAAARCPPRSDPQNSHDFLPRAMPRSPLSAALLERTRAGRNSTSDRADCFEAGLQDRQARSGLFRGGMGRLVFTSQPRRWPYLPNHTPDKSRATGQTQNHKMKLNPEIMVPSIRRAAAGWRASPAIRQINQTR